MTLRVLQLSRWMYRHGGGIRSYLDNLARALHGTDIRLSGAALLGGEPLEYLPDLQHAGHPRAPRWRNGFALARWLSGAARRFDLLHVHSVFDWTLPIAAIICLRSRIPYVVSPHGALEAWFVAAASLRQRLFLHAIVLPLLRRAAAVIVTTQASAESLRALDAGLPVSVVMPALAARPAHDHSTETGPLNVLYLGRIEPVKNLPVLVDAVASLVRSGIPVELTIAGTGGAAETSALRAHIERAGLESQVVLSGYVEGAALDTLLARAQVFALPSHSENFSYATAEAMMSGIPVVISRGVGLASLVEARNCGITFAATAPEEMAAALRRLTDPDLRRGCGQRGAATARELFSLAAMGRTLSGVYHDALARARL